MGKPTPKKPKAKVTTKKRTPRKSRRRVFAKTKKSYIPINIEAEIEDRNYLGENDRFNLPLHSQIGELDLEPYAWVTLDSEEEFDASFQLFGSKGGSYRPTTYSLKSISFTNEVGKYPTVAFELYIPDYKNKLEVGALYKDGASTANNLDKFRIGKRFSVKWGYSKAHTRWRNLRVVERGIKFDEGTAILSVKGAIGSRLSATTSAEVFSNEYGLSAVDTIASLVDISTDYSQLLEEEYQRIIDEQTRPITLSGQDLGFGLTVATQLADVEMFFNPELGALKFSTPFKKELVKRGQKPTKMLYGYPASNISKVSLSTKFPKKKGTSPKGSKPLNQTWAKGDGSAPNTTFTVVVAGPVVYNNTRFELGPSSASGQAKGYWRFSRYPTNDSGKNDDRTKEPSDANVLLNAAKVWKAEDGYRVEVFNTQNGTPETDPADVYLTSVVVKKVTKLPKGHRILESEEKVLGAEGYKTFVRGVIAGNVIGKILGVTEEGKVRLVQYTIGKETPEQKEAREKKEEDKQKKDNTPPTTTVEAKPTGDEDAPEGEETEDVYVWERAPQTKATLVRTEYLNTERGDDYREELQALQEQAKELNKDGSFKYRVRQFQKGTYTQAQIEIQTRSVPTKTRKDPSKPNAKDGEQEKNTSDTTSSTDGSVGAASFEPVSQKRGSGTGRSKKAVTKLTVDLKAGDWTMRVGKLIEIVDLYEKLDGVWYIAKEEHSISTSGFNTRIVCRKATAKQKNSYGKSRISGTGRNTSKGSDSTRKAAGDERPNSEDKIQIRDMDAIAREQDKERAKIEAEAKKEEARLQTQGRVEATRYSATRDLL